MQKNERLRTQIQAYGTKTLILRLAIPNTIGLLVIAAYSLADSFFVSSLGTGAVAAVGVSFSLHVLIQAVGYTLGMGGGSLLSRALGRKEGEQASLYAALALWSSLLIGVLITVTGLAFCDPLLRFLGASEDILPLARNYVRPLLCSAPFMCGVFVMSQLLRAEGRSVYSMIGLSVGSLCNILLDPLLISRFSLGIKGASLATLIAQALSFCVLLSAYLQKNAEIRLFTKIRGRHVARDLLLVCIAGLPSLLRQGLSGTAVILVNRAAAPMGESAVAAMSLVSRIFLLVFSLALGVGQGMMPVVGYHMGSRDKDRMKQAFRFSLIASTIGMLLISVPIYIFSPHVLSLFQNDSEVIQIGTGALRAQMLMLFTHGIVTPTILYLQAVGNSVRGTVLASARQGIFFLPLILWLPTCFGLWGLEWAQPLADLGALIFTLPFLIRIRRNLKVPP